MRNKQIISCAGVVLPSNATNTNVQFSGEYKADLDLKSVNSFLAYCSLVIIAARLTVTIYLSPNR